MSTPDISVVIPTRNRRLSIERCLRSLARQRLTADRFEVLVALDGCGDGTSAHLATLDLPYRVRVVGSEKNRGAAAARNMGAASARGDVLVFLDDDVEAEPGLLSAHLEAHRAGAQVSVGYLPPVFDGRPRDFFQATLHGWWEAMFEAMRRRGHRYWFRDLLTGNCALAASLFRDVGGFDETFRCHEDYELGVRLIDRGHVLRFVPDAIGRHHEQTRLARALERKREEGRADIAMLRKHPHVAPSLPLGVFARYASGRHRLLRRLAFRYPAAGAALTASIGGLLQPLERGRFRGRWRRRVYDMLVFWYWRGIADEVGSLPAFVAFLEGCGRRSSWSPMTLEVDVGNGLELVMAQVDRRRPDGLRVMLGERELGTIAPVPGAERLRGLHLRAALAWELSGPLVVALGETGRVGIAERDGALAATEPLPSETLPL
jgi:GT2 family glycosyltransferase